MLFSRRRVRWKLQRGKGPDGFDQISIRPAPVLKSVTFDVYEQAMDLLGIDPDGFLSGTVQLSEIPQPPITKAEAFLRIVLENAEAYDVRAMRPDYLTCFLGLVAANFLMDSAGSLLWPSPTARA